MKRTNMKKALFAAFLLVASGGLRGQRAVRLFTGSPGWSRWSTPLSVVRKSALKRQSIVQPDAYAGQTEFTFIGPQVCPRKVQFVSKQFTGPHAFLEEQLELGQTPGHGFIRVYPSEVGELRPPEVGVPRYIVGNGMLLPLQEDSIFVQTFVGDNVPYRQVRPGRVLPGIERQPSRRVVRLRPSNVPVRLQSRRLDKVARVQVREPRSFSFDDVLRREHNNKDKHLLDIGGDLMVRSKSFPGDAEAYSSFSANDWEPIANGQTVGQMWDEVYPDALLSSQPALLQPKRKVRKGKPTLLQAQLVDTDRDQTYTHMPPLQQDNRSRQTLFLINRGTPWWERENKDGVKLPPLGPVNKL